jgi:DMSO/TMAO reductase YedYZ molybdopterin-dependent catalytic subunit
MKTSSKLVIILFAVLIVAVIPLYIYTRPAPTEPGTIQTTGNIANPQNLTLTQLQALPQHMIRATLNSGGNPQDNGVFNYTGVLLKVLLSQAQISANVTSVYIQASDGYGTTLTLKDAQSDNTLIAYQKDGNSLVPLKSGGEGPFRLILGGDTYAQRWVKDVIVIKVN